MSAQKRAENDVALKAGEYGVVVATKGRHVGRVGYYDNDERSGVAVVYFDGEPFKTDYVFVKLSSLRRAEPDEVEDWRELHGNAPALAEAMRTLERRPNAAQQLARPRGIAPRPRPETRRSRRSRAH